MSYPVLNRSEARRRLEGDGGEETVKPLGPDVDWIASAALLRAKLAKLQASIGDPKTDHGSRRFDSAASRIVHQSMLLHPALADAEFWIWLTVTHFKTLIQWRYGEGADLKNYGIGGSTENFLYRLWLRGDIGHVGDAKDPYELVEVGDVDFWRSHLFRQSYVEGREFARAFIRFQFPDLRTGRPRLQIGDIRELAKRLKKARSNLLVEVMDEVRSTHFIAGEWAKMAESQQ